MRTFLLVLLFALSLTTISTHAVMIDFGDPNRQALTNAVQTGRLHLVQFGDSHTAGDYFTGAVRAFMHEKLGDGGLGYGMPMYVQGQRLESWGYDNQGFALATARNQDTGIGGVLALAKTGASIGVRAKTGARRERISFEIKQAPNDAPLLVTDTTGKVQSLRVAQNNQWQITTLELSLPFSVYAPNNTNTAIAGYWGDRGKGARISALGINGARQNIMARQSLANLRTLGVDVVALAYGTNEAVDANTNIAQARQDLINAIKILRATSQAAIVIIGAPESLSSQNGVCGVRAPSLDAIQALQREVAQSMRTLYWDWQGEMGGACTAKNFIDQKMMAKDGVHFSAQGYQQAGRRFAQDLWQVAGARIAKPIGYGNIAPSQSPASAPANTPNMGFGSICAQNCLNINN